MPGITLGHFASAVSLANFGDRLVVRNDHVEVARESFRGKILRAFSNIPWLNQLTSVKQYVSQLKEDNKVAMEGFLTALRNTYGENLGNDVHKTVNQVGNDGVKPLEDRTVKIAMLEAFKLADKLVAQLAKAGPDRTDQSVTLSPELRAASEVRRNALDVKNYYLGPVGRVSVRSTDFRASFVASEQTEIAARVTEFPQSPNVEREINAMFERASVRPQDRHFRVDVDKNLLYRKQLPKNANRSDFIKTKIGHHHYGESTVFISMSMLAFLKNQKSAGAAVSILSTGGWKEGSVRSVLKCENLEIDEFDNKKTLNQQSVVTFGLFQKYRVHGDKDKDGRFNIMVDDQPHQRAFFKHSIDAKMFGMG